MAGPAPEPAERARAAPARRRDGQRPWRGRGGRGWCRLGRRRRGGCRRRGAGGAGAGGAGGDGHDHPVPAVAEGVRRERRRSATCYFDFDRYDVRAGDKGTLDENAKWLKSNQSALLLIEGHADERGTNEYNLALGERRAKATRDYLVSVGIDAGRITVISYGEERPTCTEKAEGCWAKNRRAHFLVKQ